MAEGPGGVSPSRPKVFLSYAHDDESHRSAVLDLANLLEACGVSVEFDRWHEDLRMDWYAWMLREIQATDFVVVVASPRYRAVGDGTAPGDANRGVQAETAVLRDLVYRDRETWVGRVVPVVLPGRSLDELPAFTQPYTASHFVVESITAEGIKDLLRVLTGRPHHLRDGRDVSAAPDTSVQRWQRSAYVNHDQLFGADRLIELIVRKLANTEVDEVVSLVGDGGIGKTAIAYEAVRAATRGGRFTRVAWVSAASPQGDAGPLAGDHGASVYWLDVLKEIGDQLGFDLGLSRALWRDEFARRVAELGAGERVLVVVDNLESLPDAADAVRQLRGMGVVWPHSLLVTTRWELQQHLSRVSEYRVRLLNQEDALRLIRHLGAADPALTAASDVALAPVLDVTEGNPFLIRLVVQQYLSSHRPLDRVMRDLRQIRTAHDGTPSLAGQVRAHLYTASLRELERRCGEHHADALLASFCVKGRGDAFDYDELAVLSGIGDTDDFDNTITAACQLSVVTSFGDLAGGVLGRRYTIHSLLYDFTCGI